MFYCSFKPPITCTTRDGSVTACEYWQYVEGSFEKYLERLEDPMESAGQVEIKALSLLHRRCFVIYKYPGGPPTEITQDDFVEKILLCYSNTKHYDIVYPKTYVPAARICQTLLYELLYTVVFGVDPKDLQTAMEMWHSRRHRNSQSMCSDEGGYDTPEERRDDWDIDGPFPTEEETKLEMEETKNPEEPGTFTLPYQVVKSLDPNVYRNVEFDVWHFTRRELRKTDFIIIAGRQYFLGDKCQVRLEPKGRYYNAFIQEVGSKTSVVTVFIEELGERIQVSLANLKPVNPVPACQVTPMSQGGSAEQYTAEQEYETRGRRRFYRRPRAVAMPISCSRAQPAMGPRFPPPPGSMHPGRPAGFHGPPLPPRGVECDQYRPHPGPRSHRGNNSPRRSSRFVSRNHLIGPEVSFYHSAGKRCYQSFENYSFRPRMRRHVQTIAKECQFSLMPAGAEEAQELAAPVAYYDPNKSPHNIFPPMQAQAVGRPMVAATPSYWVPQRCNPSPTPCDQAVTSSEEDADERSTRGDQGEYSGEYVYPSGESGFESPSVYTAAESTANLTIQEGGSCSGQSQEGSATYSYSQQVVVKSAVISASQPVSHTTAELFTANSSSNASSTSSRTSDSPPDSQGFPTHHAQPPATRPVLFMSYPWHVHEMAEAVGMASPPPFSCDPNGNDLPEDYKVIQYYFNLGVQCYHSYLHSMVHSQQAYQQPDVEGQYPPYPSNALNHTGPEAYSEQEPVGHSAQAEGPAHAPPMTLDPPTVAPSGPVFYPLVQEPRSAAFLPHIYEPYLPPPSLPPAPPPPPATYHYIATWIPGAPWAHAHAHAHTVDYASAHPPHHMRHPGQPHHGPHLVHHAPASV